MSVTITPEIEAKLQAFARATGRDPQDIVEFALRQYMAQEERIVVGIRQGIDEADRGEVVSHDQMMDELEAIVVAHEQRRQ